jgi:hypothetical protein
VQRGGRTFTDIESGDWPGYLYFLSVLGGRKTKTKRALGAAQLSEHYQRQLELNIEGQPNM